MFDTTLCVSNTNIILIPASNLSYFYQLIVRLHRCQHLLEQPTRSPKHELSSENWPPTWWSQETLRLSLNPCMSPGIKSLPRLR